MMNRFYLGAGITAQAKCLIIVLYVLAISGDWAMGVPLVQEAPRVEPAPPALAPLHSPDNYKSYGLNNNTATTLWSIGQPSDDEQLYLEYINRARANPTAEGIFFATNTDPDLLVSYETFSVNLELMRYQISTNPVTPPLAMNAQLNASARFHTGDMFTNRFQSHTGSAGDSLVNRLVNAGYPYITAAENIYAYAKSVLHGHGGFEVDWGNGVGGMQTPPGHRDNIHHASFREAGISVINGNNLPVGPQVVTQNFGTRGSGGNVPMITGVAYYDFNGNNFYDLGEGIGGVTVIISNSPYYAVTADSGGYTVPVTTNGNYTLRFTASGLTDQRVVSVSNQKNLKVDFMPAFTPPTVSGPNPAILGQNNSFTVSPVGAATGYDWRVGAITNYTVVEGAESGLANVTVEAPSGYNPIATDLKASGAASFHLVYTNSVEQKLTLKPLFYLTSTSQLSFAKMLGYATTGQVAKAQVSLNDGRSWITVWQKAGTDDGGETSFTSSSVSLGAYAGKTARVRFDYEYLGGPFYPQTSSGVGLYLDNITVSNARQIQNLTTNTSGTNLFLAINPGVTNQLLVSARARINTRTLDWGPVSVVQVALPAPAIHLLAPRLTENQVAVEFTVSNYRSGMGFRLYRANAVGATWVQDTSAVLSTVTAGSRYRLTTTLSSNVPAVYKVLATY